MRRSPPRSSAASGKQVTVPARDPGRHGRVPPRLPPARSRARSAFTPGVSLRSPCPSRWWATARDEPDETFAWNLTAGAQNGVTGGRAGDRHHRRRRRPHPLSVSAPSIVGSATPGLHAGGLHTGAVRAQRCSRSPSRLTRRWTAPLTVSAGTASPRQGSSRSVGHGRPGRQRARDRERAGLAERDVLPEHRSGRGRDASGAVRSRR